MQAFISLHSTWPRLGYQESTVERGEFQGLSGWGKR
ncbi:hypothetical protein YSA_10145 [Pseudomonas putida ND6]|uniref:Uncharacterized protein n=1 Tax=Pseudomonas putida ND6 TaxID=231023 RepID=I3V3F5_PSEPU|nr:hypothetical protein YSA_10145 [Pseudomonas putida ND6]